MTTVDDSPCHTNHRSLARRFCRRLYQTGRKSEQCNSLPLIEAACQVYTGAGGGGLACLSRGDAARLTRATRVSPATVVMAMVYLERLASDAGSVRYTHRTPPKHLFLATTLAAGKCLFDDGEEEQVSNEEWADSLEMPVSRLNRIEADFLAAIDWRVCVSDDQFDGMLSRVEACVACDQSARRGWLTYTELDCVCRVLPLAQPVVQLCSSLAQVVCVCSLAYLASLLTVAAALATLHSDLVQHLVTPAAVSHANSSDASLLLLSSATPSSADSIPLSIASLTGYANGSNRSSLELSDDTLFAVPRVCCPSIPAVISRDLRGSTSWPAVGVTSWRQIDLLVSVTDPFGIVTSPNTLVSVLS